MAAGTCRFGDRCQFAHSEDGAAAAHALSASFHAYLTPLLLRLRRAAGRPRRCEASRRRPPGGCAEQAGGWFFARRARARATPAGSAAGRA
jgi:hypothetical protein